MEEGDLSNTILYSAHNVEGARRKVTWARLQLDLPVVCSMIRLAFRIISSLAQLLVRIENILKFGGNLVLCSVMSRSQVVLRCQTTSL